MWARFAAYAALGFGAACLWLFLGSSPAAADEADPGLLGSVGSLVDSTTGPVAEPVTEPVTETARQTLQQVGDVERRATETVRQVADATGVEPVRDVVHETTAAVDDATEQTLDTVDTVDPPVGQVTEEPAQPHHPDADLVQRPQRLRAEAPASHDSAARAATARPHHPPVTAFEGFTTSPQVDAPVAALVPQAAPADHGSVPDLGVTPDRAPDGTAPTGGSASGAVATLTATTVRLPRTAAVVVAGPATTAPRAPASSPGFSPD